MAQSYTPCRPEWKPEIARCSDCVCLRSTAWGRRGRRGGAPARRRRGVRAPPHRPAGAAGAGRTDAPGGRRGSFCIAGADVRIGDSIPAVNATRRVGRVRPPGAGPWRRPFVAGSVLQLIRSRRPSPGRRHPATIPALLTMLAASGFESTGCYRRHLNFAAGGRAEAVPGYTGAVRPWTGVRVTRADAGDPRRWPSRYGRDTRAASACRVGRRHHLPQPPPSRRSLTASSSSRTVGSPRSGRGIRCGFRTGSPRWSVPARRSPPASGTAMSTSSKTSGPTRPTFQPRGSRISRDRGGGRRPRPDAESLATPPAG